MERIPYDKLSRSFMAFKVEKYLVE